MLALKTSSYIQVYLISCRQDIVVTFLQITGISTDTVYKFFIHFRSCCCLSQWTNQLELVCLCSAVMQKHFVNNLQCEVTREKSEVP